jgi:uncharacterized protein
LIWLVIAFGVTALLYASIGFGGGSTYTALLALSGTDYALIAPISQLCNIVVVTGGVIRFAQAGMMPWHRALPLALIAAPCALLTAMVPITEAAFTLLLSASLFAVGLIMLFQRRSEGEAADFLPEVRTRWQSFAMAIGAGSLAGFVGIGGGIFLAPYLHLTRWARPREIAATASLFILINSAAGLAGQLSKLGRADRLYDVTSHWPLIIVVLIGGSLGTHMAVKLLPAPLVQRLTAILILFVSGQLAWRLVSA